MKLGELIEKGVAFYRAYPHDYLYNEDYLAAVKFLEKRAIKNQKKAELKQLTNTPTTITQ